jgi:hypothetical protein
MEIDIVYTWVNGSDEAWRQKKVSCSQRYDGNASIEAQSDARFMDNEELRYSIRSVFKYAPWVNRIYIVTDNQVPFWFDSNCAKVKIIDHKEIFVNVDFLPTFSARAIEANLHHIKGLSESFIYFNDDIFLGSQCIPEYFFLKDGRPRIFVSDLMPIKRKRHFNAEYLKNNKNNEHQHAIINSRNLLKETYGKSVFSEIRHGARACRKSELFHLENTFRDRLLLTMSHKFRENSDILMYHLACMYSLLSGTGRRTYVPSLSVKSQLFNRLLKKMMRFYFCYVHLGAKDIGPLLSLIEKYRPFMFCINQYHDSPEYNVGKIRPFLEKYFPEPSPAEKS